METSEATDGTTRYDPRLAWRPRAGSVILVLSAALAIIPAYLAAMVARGALSQLVALPVRPAHALDLLVLTFLIAVTPWSLHQWYERRQRLEMENRLPDFLIDLASLHKAGLTLADSIQTAASGNYGPLSSHLRMAADQVRWNLPILTVLTNLRDRIGTPIAMRSLTVVIEAGRNGGNVPEVLEVTAKNAQAFVNMRESRKRSMSMYMIITYVASMVFIGVALALQGIFVPQMLQAFSGGAGVQLAGAGFSTLPSSDEFRTLFYLAAVVQGIGNGLVGGVMSDGRVTGGLKHACVMTALAFVGFLLAG